jgi:hypothetical protein
MTLPDAVDAIRPAVVQIGVRLNHGELPRTLGTGFIVDDRSTVVTALHVITGGVNLARAAGINDRPQFVAALAHPQIFKVGDATMGMQGFSYVDLDLLSAVPAHDLAAGRMTENIVGGEWDPDLVPNIDGLRVPPLVGIATLDTSTPREGAAIAVSGYPFALNSLVTNSGSLACAFFPDFADDPLPDPPPVDDADDQKGVRVVDIRTPGPPAANRFLADLEVNGGNSGGPVYLVETGAVIGVCVATRVAPVTRAGQPAMLDGEPLGYSSGLTHVVPAVYVAAMLRDRLVSGSPERA